MQLPDLTARLRVDTTGLDQAVKKANSSTSSIGAGFKSLAGIAGGVFAGFAAFDFFKDSVGEAREATKVAKATEVVIKSTGGAAKVTATEVENLGRQIGRKAGMDNDAVQSGANLLLTFKNVRNEAGKGNDVFNQAVGLATDLSVVFGTDLKASSIQLGKALDNPIKGVTALQRVGVSFTQQQKDQIKTLVESGKTLDAQKIILAELETQVGGAAAAAVDPMQRLGVQIGDLKERVGQALIPALSGAANFLGKVLPPAADAASEGFTTFADGVGGAAKGVGSFVGFLGENEAALIAFSAVLTTVAGPAVAKFAALQAIAIATSGVSSYKTLETAVGVFGLNTIATFTRVGTAVTGLSGTLATLAGGGVFLLVGAAIAGIAIALHKLNDENKLTSGQIKTLSADIADLGARGTLSIGTLNKAFADNGVKLNDLQKTYQLFLQLQDGYITKVHQGTEEAIQNASAQARLGASFDGVDKSLADLVGSGNQETAAASLRVLAQQLGTTEANLLSLPGAFNDYSKALQSNADSGKIQAAAEAIRTEATFKSAGASKEAADKLREQKDEYDELNEAIEINSDTLRRAVDPLYNAQKAGIEYENSLAGIGKQIKDNTTSDESAAQKKRDLDAVVLATTQSAYGYASALQANGQIEAGLGPLRQAQIDKLNEIGNRYPALRPQIQTYIDKLNEVPNDKGTTLKIEGLEEAYRKMREFRDRLDKLFPNTVSTFDLILPETGRPPARAAGGPVTRYKPYVVGEKGPELFVPSRSGQIIPNGGSSGGSSGPTSVEVNFYGVTGESGARSLLPELTAAIRSGVGK